jgi:hypothetical protein
MEILSVGCSAYRAAMAAVAADCLRIKHGWEVEE